MQYLFLSHRSVLLNVGGDFTGVWTHRWQWFLGKPRDCDSFVLRQITLKKKYFPQTPRPSIVLCEWGPGKIYCMRFVRMKWSRSCIPFILINQGGNVAIQVGCHLHAILSSWIGMVAGPTVRPHLPDSPLKLLWLLNETCLNWYQCLLWCTPTLRLKTLKQWKTKLASVCPDGFWFIPAGTWLSLLSHFISIFSPSLHVLMTSGLAQDTEIIASPRLFNQLPQIYEGKSLW